MKKQWRYDIKTASPLNLNRLYEKYDITEKGYGRNKNEYYGCLFCTKKNGN